MRPLVHHVWTIILIWMVLFFIQRTVFLHWPDPSNEEIPITATLVAHSHSLSMDLATACYLTLPTLLLLLPLCWKEIPLLRLSAKAYLFLAAVLTTFIHVVDLGLFAAWGSKITHKALSYLNYPDEAIRSAHGVPILPLLIAFILESIVACWLLTLLDHRRRFDGTGLISRLSSMIVLPMLLLVGMRGGLQEFPLDRSWAYHSNHPILNQAAMNSTWNVLDLFVEPPEYETNPYQFMANEEAANRFRALHPIPGELDTNRVVLFTTQRPNILIVLLESWTADVVQQLGGDSNVTPEFDRLARDGMLFTHFYSTGFRTEQGLAALLSAFPSQPRTTIIRRFGKFDRLPSLIRTLRSAGYNSRYFYAGDASFTNTRSYLESMGVGVIYDENSAEFRRRTDWGAYDEELFDLHLRDARSEQEPFVHVLMTSTSHEPFDVPVDEGFPGKEPQQRYRNSVHYTDRVLGRFMDACRDQPWYDRTIVLLMADHGHFLPWNRTHYEAGRHRIPFLITGGALNDKFRGTHVDTLGTHVDIASTLLAQMGLPPDPFTWSKDLFSRHAPHFAFWTFEDGFGFITRDYGVEYDNITHNVLARHQAALDTDLENELVRDGQALEQVLLEAYMGLSQ